MATRPSIACPTKLRVYKMSKADSFLNNIPRKIRVDKVNSENEVIFLTRIGNCITNAKTNKAKWRLYQTAMVRIHYSWMQYIDKTFTE
jgi:midasin (ATPase involved in ribosome maturation)